MGQSKQVAIPTNQEFLEKWHAWIQSKVSSRFKRDKHRVIDAAQDVRCRLLAKDFIGRWFYKHLKHDMLDAAQSEKILGLKKGSIVFIGVLATANGERRNSPDALWRISDLLDYARFDYARYYYSIQDHNIDSDKMLKMLGKDPGNYNALASMYRQGKIFPSELTGHDCLGNRKTCPFCCAGRRSLHSKRVSLTHDWESDASREAAKKLRWNDSQLAPYLRNWQKQNAIFCVPSYIMRPDDDKGVDAGLLKYADILIQNTIVNIFKQMTMKDNMENGVDFSSVGSKDEFSPRDVTEAQAQSSSNPLDSLRPAHYVEHNSDISSIISRADLTEDENAVLESIEFLEMTARQYAKLMSFPVPKVHKIHTSAMKKLRAVASYDQEDMEI